MLEAYLRQRLRERELLLMTHIVVGYPSFEVSREVVARMVSAGVDLIELQWPFSEPMADGPVILGANQAALSAGATVDRCFEFAAEVVRAHPIPFLCMSYYNLLFRQGVGRFVARLHQAGLRGAIVPDLPLEEAEEYLGAMEAEGLAPILIFAPTSLPERLGLLGRHARGFVYVVARRGVTGTETRLSAELDRYLERCREATRLPLALGFGLRSRRDLEYLRGRVEIGVVGSETLRVLEREGAEGVERFVRELIG